MCYMVHILDIDVLYGSYLGHQCAIWFIFGTSMCYMVHILDIDVLYGSYLEH